MRLPDFVCEHLKEHDIVAEHSISGGDICEAMTVLLDGERCFLKWRADAPPRFFTWESEGLITLKNAHNTKQTGIHVPEVKQVGEKFLLLEWMEPGSKTATTAEVLGQGLALQHQCAASVFGQKDDGFIGRLTQPKGQDEDWASLYATKRLAPFLSFGDSLWPCQRLQRLETLCVRINYLLDHKPLPSLLHGDLWSGNWMVVRTANGIVPALIDPAVSYGDREQDLAMTELFGGFPSSFYNAYNEVYPIDHAGYEERRPLYQLYYLLVHLALFGESYGTSVDQILKHYAE
ncbi:fructosamine kinase family protein [Aneurinibacillus migulanus]|uniref:fructosamine kinase family protein n=3 Tax=Aneurinibacillus migulanus TaxID=47500 RepID=UPI0006B43BF1|nr:fructosamine kinase family protein [Aneurinibacillus migulanus]MCP1355169.1 fructosamine kinase family protein [Aneurinibacillus migulanus]